MTNLTVQHKVPNAVHAFFLEVLEDQLQHPVTLPAEFRDELALCHWLDLLDLAITAPMVRDALSGGVERTTLLAVLSHYVGKPQHTPADRDKADFVVTWLYRNPSEPGEWKQRGSFGRFVAEAVGEGAQLPKEHLQLLREFDFLSGEVDDFSTFEALMDSALVQRVRDIKASFGESFYHPVVLARVAEYNAHFRERFDELFHAATQQIKSFGESLQKQGYNLLTRVHDDVTVKQLTDVEEQKILDADYREAQEQFRKVSKFKKAVDSRRRTAAAPPISVASQPSKTSTAQAMQIPASSRKTAEVELDYSDPLATALSATSQLFAKVEAGKTEVMQDKIRNFVKAADPGCAPVVPLPHGNAALTQSELDAFRVDYGTEKSFRAEVVRAFQSMVGTIARIESEVAGYYEKRGSAYLWKQHADSLAYLVRASQATAANTQAVMATARSRGLIEKANSLAATLERLNERVMLATRTLAQLDNRAAGAK